MDEFSPNIHDMLSPETPKKSYETSEPAEYKPSSSAPSATGRDLASPAARPAAGRSSRDTIRGRCLDETEDISPYFSPNPKSMPIIVQRSPLTSRTLHSTLTPRRPPPATSPSKRKRFSSPSPSIQSKRRKVDKDLAPPSEACPSTLTRAGSPLPALTPLTPRRRSRSTVESPSPSKKPRVRHKPQSPFDALESKYFLKNYASDPLKDMDGYERNELMQRLLVAKPDMIQETFAADPWKVLIATIFLNVTHGTQSIPIVHALLDIWDTPEKMAQASPDEIYPCIRHLGLGHSRSMRIVDLSRAWIARPPSFDDELGLSKSSESSHRGSGESSRRESSEPRSRESSDVGLLPSSADAPLASISTNLKTDKSTDPKHYPLTPISHLPGVGRYALDSFRTFCTGGSDEWKSVRPTDKELIRFLAWKWAYHEHRRWHPERGPMGYADASYIERLITNLALTTPGGSKSPQ